MIKDRSQAICRSRWFVPAFCLALGVVILAASWLGGHPGEGLAELALMAGFGLFILLAGRSETIRGLRGDGRDERFAQIDLRATAVAGLVVITAVIVSWLVEIARGHSGSPYDWLGAIGGLSYAAAVVVFRWRG
ncbi:MAG TPA: hypothetical protein VII59_15580 [Streptosporangiaceae bacterium]